MARRNVERSCFLLLSALLLLAAALWPNRLRDSGEQSVKRYVCREMGWGLGELVELLGGQTLEETRFVAFRRSAGTEEVFLLRFREDAQGNCVDQPVISPLHEDGWRIWSNDLLDTESGEILGFAVWNENPHLAVIQVRYGVGPVQRVSVESGPSLTVIRRPERSGTARAWFYYDAAGKEL